MSQCNAEEIGQPLNTLWPFPVEMRTTGVAATPKTFKFAGAGLPAWFVKDMERFGVRYSEEAEWVVNVSRDPGSKYAPEGYELSIDARGASIRAGDFRGEIYALQTLLQIVALYSCKPQWATIDIADRPAFKRRAFMVDLGRSIWSVEMLRRLVRILARLKMNTLHLHLFDDELCGIRFQGLPVGEENPYSLSLSDLGSLGAYAEGFGVNLMLEIETWGHVGSIIHHFPNLRGGEAEWGGSSFLIGKDSFLFVRKMVEQILEILPSGGLLHLGLDEAKWFADDSVPAGYNPAQLLSEYERMVGEVARMAGRGETLPIVGYADHDGRQLLSDSNIILQPWNYWIKDKDDIERKLKIYPQHIDRRWFPMAGQSMGHHRGAYAATRLWCKSCLGLGNVEGIDLAFWGRNDFADRFLTIFAGSQFVWNPVKGSHVSNTEDAEHFDALVHPIMNFHQYAFEDMNPETWRKDSLDLVYRGFYMSGPRRGHPVAPTSLKAGTNQMQAFHQEVQIALNPLPNSV